MATSYKNEAPVTLATDSAVVNVATAAKNGQAAAGPGIVQTRTDAPKPSIWQRVLSYWPWLVGAGLVWFFWPPILALLRRLV
ncbi:hypothetical protein D0N36_09330 [Hymenobacter lapidiphilus]|uniref:hypothetical protein n=1 Tax=Hymenobacter sp. CCM 8763 TaxID=2303334 RepID=UPI000E347F9B|nr:hypothetical protein [Hymenobacter sp. CCM 8763]RFP65258.1 hypothetical protein D0N36_09330 [Hymenobacter sp. CCM 8763]